MSKGGLNLAAQIPRTMLPKGEGCRVRDVRAGRSLKRRLSEMDFTPSSSVRLVGRERGALLVIVNGVCYALGRGMAMKIMVEPNFDQGIKSEFDREIKPDFDQRANPDFDQGAKID
jgi:ferrous iron transport protein A